MCTFHVSAAAGGQSEANFAARNQVVTEKGITANDSPGAVLGMDGFR